MLQNKRQNFHHSKLPNVGDIVTIPWFPTHTYTGKFIVESFNLCDSADYHHSYGIHLVNLALLADRDVKYTVSGYYCEVIA